MAQSTEGLVAIGDYAGNDDTAGDAIDVFLALIADPDSTSTTGAQAGGGYLDEMSPAAVAQLRGELTARRSDEPRVGQECVRTCTSRWSPLHIKRQRRRLRRASPHPQRYR